MITEIFVTVNKHYTVRAVPCEIKPIHNNSKGNELFSKITHLSAISKRAIVKSRFLKSITNENFDYIVFNNYGYGFVIYAKELDYIEEIDPNDKENIMSKLKDKLVSIMINLDNKNYGDNYE